MNLLIAKNRMRSMLVLPLVLILSMAIAPSVRAESHKELTGVVSKMLINASPEEIFRAVRDYRYSDTTKRSVIEEKKGRSIIKEKFASMPILGDVECTYEEIETPYTRIDFQMVTSNKLKVFEGNWILTPVEGTKSTLVKLTTYIDSGLTIPAKDFLQHLTAHQDIHRRLAFVKKAAEDAQTKHDSAAAEKKS
ncbi:MAG: SRPBCC family protein [Candidatus Melainabacteria bacterium]|nr:SRPBCC family protein [Candidatus Melainabacteria bacterium]